MISSQKEMKQSIQISDNVTDIMKLPCIFGAWKYPYVPNSSREKYPVRGHQPKEGDIIYDFRQGWRSDFAMKGDWLLEHENGTWEIISNEDHEYAVKKGFL